LSRLGSEVIGDVGGNGLGVFRCGVCAMALLAAACSSSTPAGPPALEKSPPNAPELWGGMKPIVSVKELMKYIIDPSADNIFNSVRSVMTKAGTVETVPKTDADWEQIQIGAVTLAEGAYLLKVRRPFAPPGDMNLSEGLDPLELSPDQITARVERDPVEWNARIETLRNVALEVMDIVKRRRVDELWDAGENLDVACEGCHRGYWYPGERRAPSGR
jgi:hypothetical protein